MLWLSQRCATYHSRDTPPTTDTCLEGPLQLDCQLPTGTTCLGPASPQGLAQNQWSPKVYVMGLKCVHTARCPGTCRCLFSHVCRPTSRAVIFKVWSLNRYHRRHWELVRNAQSQAPRQNQTLCGRSPASCMLTSP